MKCISCPKCNSTNIKKNGHTRHGKQNHKCKDCGRQFVLNNTHHKTDEQKRIVENLLKERISLRAICRAVGVSMTWLLAYARVHWDKTPRDIGEKIIQKVKNLQVFGLQMDEMWSFVGKKSVKCWIWICCDPIHRLVIAYHIGGRDKKAAQKFWDKVPHELKQCNFETDDWGAYESIIPKEQHKTGKDLTYFIEGFNATVRARASYLVIV